jgi:hypothetical protein
MGHKAAYLQQAGEVLPDEVLAAERPGHVRDAVSLIRTMDRHASEGSM